MDGRMGIGAPTAGVVPFVHVARLFTKGRALGAIGTSSVVVECTGDGRGELVCLVRVWVGTTGALSLVIKDLLNHDGFEDNTGESSLESFAFL